MHSILMSFELGDLTGSIPHRRLLTCFLPTGLVYKRSL